MAQDYSLIGLDGARAVETGLANPNWYRTKVDPQKIRDLMVKSDGPALRNTALWFGLLIFTAGMGIYLWPSWWSAPFWLVYGVLYGSGSDARWHECGHRTAFKTPWMNDFVYQIASFMVMRSPTVWRASHVRHHTDTIIVGRDPEIQAMRPPDLLKLCINLFALVELRANVPRMILHASGKLHPEEETYVRSDMAHRVFRTARIWLMIYAAVFFLAIATQSILPLMVIGLPTLYGAWHRVITGALQHLALAENVTDHRLNTRTVLMNPISRFIYMNMNYHIEHHMFTMVPYHRLPELHELIKHDTPAADPSIFAAFRRMVPVLIRQLRYEDAVLVRPLPETATPYRDEVKALLPHAV